MIADFDAAYADYNVFQSTIERYWSLQWIAQSQARELDAAVMKDGLVRADALPLVFRAIGAEALPRGARVRVQVGGIDLLTLDLHAAVLQRLPEGAAAAASATLATPADDDGDEAEAGAGPLTIAVDLAEGTGPDDAEPVVEPATA